MHDVARCGIAPAHRDAIRDGSGISALSVLVTNADEEDSMKTQLSKAPKPIANRAISETISAARPDSPASAPGREEIGSLAYRYWQERGCPAGCPEEDWYRAERELASRSRTIQ
jgi:Protein of unknown function (DUF2934)